MTLLRLDIELLWLGVDLSDLESDLGGLSNGRKSRELVEVGGGKRLCVTIALRHCLGVVHVTEGGLGDSCLSTNVCLNLAVLDERWVTTSSIRDGHTGHLMMAVLVTRRV